MVNITFEPTPKQREQVEALKGFGVPEEDIALMIVNDRTDEPICRNTLRKAFPYELKAGNVKANAKVAESLYKQAVEGNMTAAIWWTKTRMGWKETQGVEHSGKVTVTWDE